MSILSDLSVIENSQNEKRKEKEPQIGRKKTMPKNRYSSRVVDGIYNQQNQDILNGKLNYVRTPVWEIGQIRMRAILKVLAKGEKT